MSQALFQGDIFSRVTRGEAAQSHDEVRESVRHHLENLLNALQGRDDLPAHFREVTRSLATYGLHGFNSANLESHNERHKIMGSIKKAIQLFEPRLEQVEIEDHGIIHPFILTF